MAWRRYYLSPPTPYQLIGMEVDKRRTQILEAYQGSADQLAEAAPPYAIEVGRLVVARAAIRQNGEGLREIHPLSDPVAEYGIEFAMDALSTILSAEQRTRWCAAGSAYRQARRLTQSRSRRQSPKLRDADPEKVLAEAHQNNNAMLRDAQISPTDVIGVFARRAVTPLARDASSVEIVPFHLLAEGMVTAQIRHEQPIVARSFALLSNIPE
jgi:hypothetical protein